MPIFFLKKIYFSDIAGGYSWGARRVSGANAQNIFFKKKVSSTASLQSTYHRELTFENGCQAQMLKSLFRRVSISSVPQSLYNDCTIGNWLLRIGVSIYTVPLQSWILKFWEFVRETRLIILMIMEIGVIILITGTGFWEMVSGAPNNTPRRSACKDTYKEHIQGTHIGT